MRARLSHVAKLRPIACGVMLAFAGGAWANPNAPQVVHGSVQMSGLGTANLRVTNSPNAIINWQGFSIGASEVTRFVQQSSSSAVLNRVVGADISKIQGQLLSNGRVYLINPAGIAIGPGAVIDTAAFVGSTLNMLDADFLAGKLRFSAGATAGAITNAGAIKAGPGGHVILMAPSIENSGTIEVKGGDIVLAAGRTVTIATPRLEGIHFEVQAPGDAAVNLGKLTADDGAVGMFAGTLRHSGDIRANALARDEAGRVVLKAQGDAIVAGAGTISAKGKTGGTVQVLGNRVGLFDSASVDASGENGGGTILVGGDFRGANPQIANAARTFVGPGAGLGAGWKTAGSGGTIVVWADEVTRYYGHMSARGGAQSGDGGALEVSGRQHLDFRGTVD